MKFDLYLLEKFKIEKDEIRLYMTSVSATVNQNFGLF